MKFLLRELNRKGSATIEFPISLIELNYKATNHINLR